MHGQPPEHRLHHQRRWYYLASDAVLGCRTGRSLRLPAGGQLPRERTTLRGLHPWGGPTALAERRSGTEPRIESPEEVSPGLAEVRVGENESFESALRRFNKKIQQSGILAEARRREHYEKPSVKRKRKEAKRKKVARQQPA